MLCGAGGLRKVILVTTIGIQWQQAGLLREKDVVEFLAIDVQIQGPDGTI